MIITNSVLRPSLAIYHLISNAGLCDDCEILSCYHSRKLQVSDICCLLLSASFENGGNLILGSHSCDAEASVQNWGKMSLKFCIRIESNSQRTFFTIIPYTNMAVVTYHVKTKNCP